MRRLILPLLATACLSACGGDSMSGTTQSMPPAQPMAVDFTAFSVQLLKSESDTAQPLTVNAAQFVFPDNDNLSAFAAVLSGS
jgi:outer membrane PBP1 activator LpoA protein